MNNLDKQYQALLQDILDNGHQKGDRTGTGTISVFGRQIRHNMKDGFPLLTTKKMYTKGIITELLWFLRGDTNIKYLVDNDCHIWNGDAYKNYADSHTTFKDGFVLVTPMAHSKESFIDAIKTDDEFAKKWGELGPIYGKQWRRWNKVNFDNMIVDYSGDNTGYTLHEPIDQITNLINDLKTNPDSRRLMVNAWNVGELDQMTLPPCHYGFQVYTRMLNFHERSLLAIESGWRQEYHIDDYKHEDFDKLNIPSRAISLMWNQRSVDTFLGLPFNIASYGLLLEIIAKAVNMVPDELIGNLGDTHLYSNHIEQAKEQIGREMSVAERMEYYGKHFMKETESKTFDELLKINYDELNIPTRTREPYPLPKLDIHPGILDYDLDKLEIDMFTIKNYQFHPTIKAKLSN